MRNYATTAKTPLKTFFMKTQIRTGGRDHLAHYSRRPHPDTDPSKHAILARLSLTHAGQVSVFKFVHT